MKNLTSIIVDDEPHGRENLKLLIESFCEGIEVICTAETVIAAKELVLEHKPDVVFLDINMPELDGFDFLECFEKRDFMVVIVSAHSDYGVRAVKTCVEDFLLKPIHIKELNQTVKKLIALKEEKEKTGKEKCDCKISLPTSSGFEVVEIVDIIRFESDGSYTKVYIKERKPFLISKTLKELEYSLLKCPFYRIHKSHLINLHYIKEYSKSDGGYVTLKDGSSVEISRRKANDFIRTVKKILNNS